MVEEIVIVMRGSLVYHQGMYDTIFLAEVIRHVVVCYNFGFLIHMSKFPSSYSLHKNVIVMNTVNTTEYKHQPVSLCI